MLETALDAVVAIRGDGNIVAWNAAAEQIFGWSTNEALGQSMAELIVPAQHRQAHCEGLNRYLATGEEHVLNRRIEISALKKGGEEIPIELSITKAPFAGEPIFLGFLRDISDRRRSEARVERQAREARLLFQVTHLASETESLDDTLRSCLQAICELTGWPVGHALIVASGNARLESAAIWHEAEPGIATTLQAATENVSFTAGVGLPGVILETGEPAWMADLDTDPKFLRKGHGFGAAFGFPIRSEGKVIAVLEFFALSAIPPDEDLLLTVRTLGEQVGRVLERKRTEEHQKLLVNELNHRVKIPWPSYRASPCRPSRERRPARRRARLSAAGWRPSRRPMTR
ncbi:MAG: PAS domain S-box protein [Sphingosinicella sp.]|nr:PAS domain S-box protein [Sphingosinicella sp.]